MAETLEQKIKRLEEEDALIGIRKAQGEHDISLQKEAAIKYLDKQAFNKGVVGSGQVSAKDFSKIREGRGDKASKALAAASTAKNISDLTTASKAAEGAEVAKGGADAAGGASGSAYAAAGKMALEAGTGKSLGANISGNKKTAGAIDGMASGALTGSAFGPWGAAAGAVIGGLSAGASARAAAKAQNKKIEADKIARLGEIEEDKSKNIANALNQMGQRMTIR